MNPLGRGTHDTLADNGLLGASTTRAYKERLDALKHAKKHHFLRWAT